MARALAAAQPDLGDARAQIVDQSRIAAALAANSATRSMSERMRHALLPRHADGSDPTSAAHSHRVDAAAAMTSAHHAVSRNSSRPISMRRISLVPAPISYSLASRSSRPVG